MSEPQPAAHSARQQEEHTTSPARTHQHPPQKRRLIPDRFRSSIVINPMLATKARPALEIEAKLLIATPAEFRALGAIEAIGAYPLLRRRTMRLYSLYLDSEDFALLRRGVALRLRRHGHNWEATAKWAGSVRGAVHSRPELTVPLAGAPAFPFRVPRGPLAARLDRATIRKALHTILITDIRRERFDVMPRGMQYKGQPLAELALDDIALRAPSGRTVQRYHELELELRAGPRSDLRGMVRRLRHEFGLRPSTGSKFSRGLQALYGTDLPS